MLSILPCGVQDIIYDYLNRFKLSIQKTSYSHHLIKLRYGDMIWDSSPFRALSIISIGTSVAITSSNGKAIFMTFDSILNRINCENSFSITLSTQQMKKEFDMFLNECYAIK